MGFMTESLDFAMSTGELDFLERKQKSRLTNYTEILHSRDFPPPRHRALTSFDEPGCSTGRCGTPALKTADALLILEAGLMHSGEGKSTNLTKSL